MKSVIQSATDKIVTGKFFKNIVDYILKDR